MSQSKRETALVIGGSMAGLLAARALANHFKKVIVLDRDLLPENGDHRRGVPHGRHAHALLAGGLTVLEDLFPGFTGGIVSRGAIHADPANDGNWFFEGNTLCRAPSGAKAIMLSRPFLECSVRRHVSELENVSIEDGVTVKNLRIDNDRVTGILTGEGEITADLVVDASGRGSQSPKWLEEIGFKRPIEEKVEVQLSYTTRLFHRRPDHLDGDIFLVIPPTPEGKRGGVIAAQEGNRWIVTLFGHFGEVAPEDLDGFREFAATLPCGVLHKTIVGAEPIGEPCTFKFPASTRRRYEKLERFPKGFLVFGDAICSFNPIYGQGMTSAALQAKVLDDALAKSNGHLAKHFFRNAGKVIDNPWSVAVGGDLKMPETIGPRSRAVDFINWYLTKLHKTAHTDATATHAFLRVAQLIDPPPAIFAPKIAFRVLKHSLFGNGNGAGY
jgi:2-polyprenyl-6-methoxyphenol hydroxylase-like FAD-dependent oxidoreductase